MSAKRTGGVEIEDFWVSIWDAGVCISR